MSSTYFLTADARDSLREEIAGARESIAELLATIHQVDEQALVTDWIDSRRELGRIAATLSYVSSTLGLGYADPEPAPEPEGSARYRAAVERVKEIEISLAKLGRHPSLFGERNRWICDRADALVELSDAKRMLGLDIPDPEPEAEVTT
jgi:hypothetical protein